MKTKRILFGLSMLLFIIVVPYSILEWFDNSIPFSSSLYLLSGFSAFLLAANAYFLFRK